MMHICNFTTVANVQHVWNGKVFRWDFSRMFGPLFLRKDGEPKEVQPTNPDCQSWQAFEDWHKNVFQRGTS